MRQYLVNQYPEWHIIAIKSIKKIITHPEEFYEDLISNDGDDADFIKKDNLFREIRNGWLYEAVSHAEQSIEDLFSLLKCAESPDYFIRDVVVYKANEIKNYIWNFKSDDLKFVIEQFHLPYYDISTDKEWEHKNVFEAYKSSVLLLQRYVKELIKFHKYYFLDYCQYKHGMSVALRFNSQELDKPTVGAFKTYDSYKIDVRMNQTKEVPALAMDCVPEIMPYLSDLHNEKNLLHYTLHVADLDEFAEIAEKALILLNMLRTNLFTMIDWDGTEKVREYAFPMKNRKKLMRIGFPCLYG